MNLLRHLYRHDDALLERHRHVQANGQVGELLDALRRPPLAEETASELLMLNMIHANREASTASHSEVKTTVKRHTRLATIALATAATMALTGGLAYAGALPGAAQSTASDALARVGVSVPGPNQHAGTHPSTRGNSVQAHLAAPAGNTQHATPNNAHGKAVSTLARTTTATGRDKGQAVSTLASGGKSNAGNPPGQTTHPGKKTGQKNAHPGKPTSSHGKSSTSGSGTTTAGTASGGKNATGASTSTTASDGHSSAGSQNAGTHPHN